MATYSPLSFGSLPGTMPITLRAGSGTGTMSNRTAMAALVLGRDPGGGVTDLAAEHDCERWALERPGPERDIVLERGQGSSRDRERRRRVEGARLERDRLEVPTVVSRRHQARPLDLGRD